MEYLLIDNETTVELTAYIDANGDLQISHASGNLTDYSDALQAEDEGTSIQIKLLDFSVGGSAWTINASHDGAGGPISWTRGTNYAAYTFNQYMSNFLEVSISASSSSTNKDKVIDIKTKPRGSLPDHPAAHPH